MKKILWVLLLLIIFLMFVFFAYFYYVKPQREYIKVSSQNCINKAMEPINSETAKYQPNPYKTKAGFDEMLKAQSIEVSKCMGNYDTILFSSAEKNLFKLDLDSKINTQQKSIDSYNNKIDERLAQQKQQQDKQTDCSNMRTENKSYQDCVSAEIKKGNTYYSSVDYISSIMSPNVNDKKNICLQKYNYLRFGVSETDCLFLNLGF